MSRTPTDTLSWVEQGTELMRSALNDLGGDEASWQADSGLPGWTRKHLIAHVASNAEALGNLVTWARTGVETPMYTSPEQRTADIETGSTRSATGLREWFDTSATALASGWAELDEDQWQTPIKTAQGRTLPATQVPWLRAREVMIHPVDLATGVSFADLPEDFLIALIDDIVARRSTSGGPAVSVVAEQVSRRWEITGDGEPATISGPLPEIAAWLAGRPARLPEDRPTLPAWL